MKNQIKKGILTLIFSLVVCGIFSMNTQAATKSIRFQKNSKNITMYASQKKTLKVSVAKKYKSNKIIFSSSNKKIARVNKKGTVKALKKGTATVYAQVKGTSKKARTKIKVLQNVDHIKIIHTDLKYYVGKEYNLKSSTTPLVTDETIKWKSSNKKIAKIDQNGKLKVKSAGNVTITAYSSKTDEETSLQLKTENVPEIRIKEGKKIFVKYGEGIQLHLEFINHPEVKMTFSTYSDVIKITPSGYITTTRPGTATITATSADKKYSVSADIYITVKNGFVSNAMLDNLGLDECTNLMIVAHPDDETLWGGAHLQKGKWFVVCMTSQYFQTRKTEYFNVLNKLGVKGMILDYPDLYRDGNNKWKVDSWKYVLDGLGIDINKIINYKNWNQIVSHSPTGETGHRHHLAINKAVVKSCKESAGKYDKLWFFGKFYAKGLVPEGLPQITSQELAVKEDLLKLYVREQGSIKAYWEQMNPYENWEKATNYKY